MASPSFDTLMRHHAWAVERLLDTAALVPPDALDADASGHGSPFATLRHIADVDQSWGRAARGGDIRDESWMHAELVDLARLRTFWLEEAAALVVFTAALSPADLDRPVQPPWKQHPYALWQVLTHITSHRAEHGYDAGWQLTALGHSPGELSFMGFVDLERRGTR